MRFARGYIRRLRHAALAQADLTTAGRKAVIGRPILYKTTREFLLRFGLRDVSELPSMEELERGWPS